MATQRSGLHTIRANRADGVSTRRSTVAIPAVPEDPEANRWLRGVLSDRQADEGPGQMINRRRGESGAALVEFALLLPLIALLVFGTIDIARAYRLNVRLEAAAREGAAFSQIFPNDVTCSGNFNDLKDRVELEDPDLSSHGGYAVRAQRDIGGGTFVGYDICESDGDAPVVSGGDRVRVEVDGDFSVITPILGSIIGDPLSMTGTAEVVAQG